MFCDLLFRQYGFDIQEFSSIEALLFHQDPNRKAPCQQSLRFAGLQHIKGESTENKDILKYLLYQDVWDGARSSMHFE